MQKQTLIGNSAYYLTECLYRSIRSRVYAHPDFDPEKQCVYAFWHRQLFLPIMSVSRMTQHKKMAGLVSASRDGEILTTWINRLGLKVARGSSSRRGARGLSELLTLFEDGYSLGIACDGPRGPIYQAKIGAAYLAQKTGVPIIPLGAAYSHVKRFKSWDRFKLPLPFSKGMIYVNQPIIVPPEADLEMVTTKLAETLHASDAKAEVLLDANIKQFDEPLNELVLSKRRFYLKTLVPAK